MRGTILGWITANVERCRQLAESSPSIVTPLNRIIGYEAAAKIAKHSVKQNVTVAQAVRDLGYVERGEISEEELATALDVASMTAPKPVRQAETRNPFLGGKGLRAP